MSTAVVFYRNMNLGHRNSPSRQVLEDTLRAAGASSARSFQTNGTVLVQAAEADARQVVERAAPGLAAACGYRDAAFVRALDGCGATAAAGRSRTTRCTGRSPRRVWSRRLAGRGSVMPARSAGSGPA